MHIHIKPCLLTLLLATAAIPVCAKQPVSLYSPEAQVLCDKYICATATDGVSHAMTEKYLGREVTCGFAIPVLNPFYYLPDASRAGVVNIRSPTTLLHPVRC